MQLANNVKREELKVYIQQITMYSETQKGDYVDVIYAVADKTKSPVLGPDGKTRSTIRIHREQTSHMNVFGIPFLEDLLETTRRVVENYIADDLGIPRDETNKMALEGNELLKQIVQIGIIKKKSDPDQETLELKTKEGKDV